MSEAVSRKDAYVCELIGYYDRFYEKAEGDTERAWGLLSTVELNTLTAELAKVSKPDPASLRHYLENYHIIQTKGEAGKPPRLQAIFPFKESQEILWADYIECWDAGIPVFWILLKARQIGWSTICAGMSFHRTIFNPLTNTLLLADEKVRSSLIFNMCDLAWERLPWWMRPERAQINQGEVMRFDRKDREMRLRRPGLRSAIYADAANKPSGSSRGATLHCVHCTEVSSYIVPEMLSTDIVPAIAKDNPLVLAVLESTAEGRNNDYQRRWRRAMEGKGRWRPVFAAWWKEKAYSKPFSNAVERAEFKPTAEEGNIRAKVLEEFGHEVTDEQFNWRRQEAYEFEDATGDSSRIDQEYPPFPDAAFIAQGYTAFPKRKLNEIGVRDVRTPREFIGDLLLVNRDDTELKPTLVRFDNPADSPLWIWEFPVSSDHYYIGADIGQGIPGQDFSVASVWRIPGNVQDRVRQVAEWKGYCGATDFARKLAHLGLMYNTAELSPECNSITTVVDNLINVHNYPRLYRWQHPDKVVGRYTNYFGFLTGHKSRKALVDNFRTLMMEDSLYIRSQRLLDECYSFVDDGSRRFEAAEGCHDDTLFAAMIAVYCLLKMDPAWLEEQITSLPVDKSVDFYNTDWSAGDDVLDRQDNDFLCL